MVAAMETWKFSFHFVFASNEKGIVSACITDRPCITERAHLRIRKIFHTRETLQNPSQMKFE